MWTSCWICPVTLTVQPGSRNWWLTVTNLPRTSSQTCSTRSEGCRSSPRLRRNDGVPAPPALPPQHPPASALTSPLPITPHSFLYSNVNLLPLRIFFFPLVVRPSVFIPFLFFSLLFISSSSLSLPGSSPINDFYFRFF